MNMEDALKKEWFRFNSKLVVNEGQFGLLEVFKRSFGRERMLEKKILKVDEYEVGPYKVCIFSSPRELEFIYAVSDSSVELLSEKLVEHLSSTLADNIAYKIKGLHLFDKFLAFTVDEAVRQLQGYLELSEETARKVALSLAFRCAGLSAIAPLLLDDKVEEFYLDGKEENVYLDHRDWGRCKTNIILSDKDIERVLTRIRLESGFRLDEVHPSLKAEVLTKFFRVRVLVDIPPIAAKGIMLTFRRMRKKPYTIPELIYNGTISVEAAAYLLFCILRRFNICVIGEPRAGKTTMINALDLMTPLNWRKVYVEDVIESLSLQEHGSHQAKVKVKPPEEEGEKSKAKEITQLLHRSPDWVFLGEIRTREDSWAMFHALTAGLVGLQTCHGRSVEDIILRWVIHHGIPLTNLKALDIIVEMKMLPSIAGRPKRRVMRIVEASDDPRKFLTVEKLFSGEAFIDVFAWSPERDELSLVTDLLKTPSLKKIRKRFNASEEEVLEEMDVYKFTFSKMVEKKIFTVKDNVSILNHLYYLSSNVDEGEMDWKDVKREIKKIIEKLH